MPKRKSNEDAYEYLKAKFKELERKILRGKRNTIASSSSPSSSSESDKSSSRRDCRRDRKRKITSSSSNSSSTGRSEQRDRHVSNKTVPSNNRRRILRIISSSSDDEQLEERDQSSRAIVHEPAGAPEPDVAPPERPHAAAALPETPVDKQTPNASANPEPDLDADFLEILGLDPTKTTAFGKDIQKDLAVRWEFSATSGLTKESRKELTDKYLIPANCKLINAPSLNLEIKAALSDILLKRDKAIESKQKLIAVAISALGEAIDLLRSSKEKNPILMRILMDSGRLLCDSQHNDSLTRRNFILSSLKKDMKDQLQDTKIDNLLFGQNFSDTLKAARAINKSGADLKAAASPKPTPSSSKNWKNSNLAGKQTAPKIEEKASAPTKSARFNSSKKLQTRRNEYSRR